MGPQTRSLRQAAAPAPAPLARPARRRAAAPPPRPPRVRPPPPRAAPLGSTVSVDEPDLRGAAAAAAANGAKAPRESSKDGKVLHPDLINPNILRTQ
jgi:hypothetical protein